MTKLSCSPMIWPHARPLSSLITHQIVSLSQYFCVLPGPAYWRERGGRGPAWSRIIRLQESLGLHKSFNPLWSKRSSRKRCKQMSSSSYFFPTCNDGKSPGRLQDPGDFSPRRLLRHRDGSRRKRTDPGRVSLSKGSSKFNSSRYSLQEEDLKEGSSPHIAP